MSLVRRPTTSVRAAAVLAVAGSVLAGCSLHGGPSPDSTARAAAAQLATTKLTGGAFEAARSAHTAEQAARAGLGTVTPSVSVAATHTSGSSATATLRWSWPIAAHPWAYNTTLHLRRVGAGWKAQWTPSSLAPGLTKGGRLVAARTAATRGDILGAGGTPLVEPRPVVRLGIDKTKVGKGELVASATALVQLVGVDVAPYVRLAKASGPEAFVPAITFRRAQVPPTVSAGVPAIKGAVAISTTLPLAPSKDFAAAILGSVGPATAAIVKQSKGRVQGGDTTGLSGLEERYDARLAGTPGVKISLLPPHGRARTLFTSAPVAGKPLTLTLSRRLQALAQRDLAGVGPASALVAIRPSTGAILAAASGPGSQGYDTATYGQYAPGSTFKIITSLALLRSGLTPGSLVHCTPSLDIDGKQFTNDSEYPPGGVGRISLTTALANSCNTAFLSEHGRLHGTDLAQAAAALGFGVDADTGFSSYFGQVPKPASEVEGAADMIGQGRVLASPMAMATVVASVVAGHAVTPALVRGRPVTVRHPAVPLTAKEDRELTAMMRAVVTTPTGTGHGLIDVPGKPVIAKTGTAQFGTKPPLPTHAWMVAGQGDLAVAVFVDEGHTGAGVAGPILEAFLRGA